MPDYGIRIRPPRDGEGAVCRMLLPEVLRLPGTPEYLLAVQDGRPQVLGAASWIAAGNAITGIRVHVVPACRRRGVGSSLLRSMLAGAAARDCRRAAAVFDALSEPGAESFLRSLGFGHEGTMEVVEAELDTARERVTALLERVKNSGRVPAPARIVPFSQSRKDQVAALHAGYIARITPEPMAVPGELVHSLERLTAPCSVVLEVDGVVAGFMLPNRQHGAAVVCADHPSTQAVHEDAGWLE
jgi:GNAT superfamily N-acetyltransferase